MPDVPEDIFAIENKILPGAVAILFSLGINPDKTDKKGRTPLMAAAKVGDVDMVRLLIEGGANISAKDQDGHTALHWANGNRDIIRVLNGVITDPVNTTPQLMAIVGACMGFVAGVAAVYALRASTSYLQESKLHATVVVTAISFVGAGIGYLSCNLASTENER